MSLIPSYHCTCRQPSAHVLEVSFPRGKICLVCGGEIPMDDFADLVDLIGPPSATHTELAPVRHEEFAPALH